MSVVAYCPVQGRLSGMKRPLVARGEPSTLAAKAQGTHVAAYLLAFGQTNFVAAAVVNAAVQTGDGGFGGESGKVEERPGLKPRAAGLVGV
jgi:hypothetical protein